MIEHDVPKHEVEAAHRIWQKVQSALGDVVAMKPQVAQLESIKAANVYADAEMMALAASATNNEVAAARHFRDGELTAEIGHARIAAFIAQSRMKAHKSKWYMKGGETPGPVKALLRRRYVNKNIGHIMSTMAPVGLLDDGERNKIRTAIATQLIEVGAQAHLDVPFNAYVAKLERLQDVASKAELARLAELQKDAVVCAWDHVQNDAANIADVTILEQAAERRLSSALLAASNSFASVTERIIDEARRLDDAKAILDVHEAIRAELGDMWNERRWISPAKVTAEIAALTDHVNECYRDVSPLLRPTEIDDETHALIGDIEVQGRRTGAELLSSYAGATRNIDALTARPADQSPIDQLAVALANRTKLELRNHTPKEQWQILERREAFVEEIATVFDALRQRMEMSDYYDGLVDAWETIAARSTYRETFDRLGDLVFAEYDSVEWQLGISQPDRSHGPSIDALEAEL